MRKSHAIDSSQPPPNASEFTEAIVTVDDFSMPVMNPCAERDQLLALRAVHLRELLDVRARART